MFGLFLAAAPTGGIQTWLHNLVPLDQIVKIVGQVTPAFVLVGVFILVIGFTIEITEQGALGPTGRHIILFACIAAAPWMMSLAEGIAAGLVAVIGSADPALNWLIVNNPSDATLAVNFGQPYAAIGKWVAGKFGDVGQTQWWEIGKWADYLVRSFFIFAVGLFAAVTVFIMEVMLLLQKLILVGSRLACPIFFGCLALPAARASAINFFKSILGVTAWPVGWAIVHIGTMAALKNLTPPSWTASLGTLIVSVITFGLVCLWMVVATLAAPKLIAMAVANGSNFAGGLVGNFASAAGQHAANAAKSGSMVGGAVIGSLGGPSGAVAGAALGGQVGGAMAAPITAAAEVASSISDGGHAIPSSRSARVADAALKAIIARA
jgi:hypothetical protein